MARTLAPASAGIEDSGADRGGASLSPPAACAKAPRSPQGRHAGAGVVELADTPDLGSGGASRGGSSPSARTTPADGQRQGWTMQVTETLSEGLKRAYTVVVPAADIESQARRQAGQSRQDAAACPGFRPGKVPLTVVRQRYGTAVTAEVLEESVNEATQQVLTERGLRPALQPKIDVVSLDPSGGAAQGPGVQGRARAAAGDHAARFQRDRADPDEGRGRRRRRWTRRWRTSPSATARSSRSRRRSWATVARRRARC